MVAVNTIMPPRAEGPDFVGIGAQKSGTTWVGDILSQHPDVYIKKKEISFFVRYFHRGYDWYHEFFKEKNGRRAGEISVNYIISPRPDSTHKEFYPKWNPRRKLTFWQKQPPARDELKVHYPGLLVFAILRNPVDRAWSHYWYWRNRKERLGKRIVSFEKMFADDGRWIRTYGFYADLIAYWREAFPDMAVYFYDDIRRDPMGLVREIFRFVGVTDSFEPVVERQVNIGSYEPMPQNIRSKLVDVYHDQIRRLADMTNRDLSYWLEIE